MRMIGKDSLKFLSFIVFCLIPLSACVTDRDITYLHEQILALNNRVTQLQERTDAKIGRNDFDRMIDQNVAPRMKSIADMGADLDQIRGAVETLSGRVEDNERLIKQVVEKDLTRQDAMEAKLAELVPKVNEMEMSIRRQQGYLGLEPPPVQEEKKEGVVVEPRSTPPPLEQAKSREVDLYDSALAAFREEKFEQAMDGFKGFLKEYPKSDRADNAQFWIGECFMALKQYEQAILAFQEVIKKYPKGNKVPNAMLRQALAFLEIKDQTSGKIMLKKIIKEYPNSSEAKIAEAKLKTVK